MLRFLIALALVVSSVQCAAACTPQCDPQPACHHHKQAPSQNTASCHELVPATTVQSFVVHVFFSSYAVESFVDTAVESTDVPVFQDPSPPLLKPSSHSILRI